MNMTSNRSTPGRAMIVCILTDWHATEESSDNLSNASELEWTNCIRKTGPYSSLSAQYQDLVLVQYLCTCCRVAH